MEWRHFHYKPGKAHLWFQPYNSYWHSRCGQLLIRQLEIITEPWTPSSQIGQCSVCQKYEQRQRLQQPI